jgi:GntR family transcriptional regulator, transcriptional repressor for pyruvate dehydrogenase complex
MKIEPVRKARVFESIVDQIQRQILAGELKPGDRLPNERDLAVRFGVSRASVREALAALQLMGLIESRVGGGTYARKDMLEATISPIARILAAEIDQAGEPLEVRRILEPQIAWLAAERATPEDLAELERCLEEQQSRVAAAQPTVEQDEMFHSAIAKATRNRVLEQLVGVINNLIKPSRLNPPRTTEDYIRTLLGHKSILEAIRRHDQQAAFDCMADHIDTVHQIITRRIAEEAGVSATPMSAIRPSRPRSAGRDKA